jgi:sugar phosphate isomerase/epimerase
LNVRLTIHNHLEECRNNFAELREILSNTSPQDVSPVLDIAHAEHAGADIGPFIRRYTSRTGGLHMRDWVGDQNAPFGSRKQTLALLIFDRQHFAFGTAQLVSSGFVLDDHPAGGLLRAAGELHLPNPRIAENDIVRVSNQ